MANKPYLTASGLIELVKKKAAIPIASSATFSNQDLLDFANEEMQMGIVPSVLQLHEEFFLDYTSVPLEANQRHYQIPYRAIGAKLRDLVHRDIGGNFYEMSRISPDEKVFYQYAEGNWESSRAFYIENDSVVLVPGPGNSPNGSLDMGYYVRPNQLVMDNQAAIITAMTVNGSDTVLSLSSAPSAIVDGSVVDFLQTRPGHKTRKMDYTMPPGSVNQINKTYTLPTSALPTGLVVGDYLAVAETAIIPQVPGELHPVLAQRVVCRCLEAMGDTQGLQNAMAKLADMESRIPSLIDNRAESAPLKAVNYHSPIRYNRYIRRNARFP